MDERADPPTAGRSTWLLAGIGVGAVVTALAAVLASAVGADEAGLFRWLNDPPAALDAVLSATNPLLRPFPLAGVIVVVALWLVLSTPSRRDRIRLAARGVGAAALAWVLGTVLKVIVATPRPLAALADVSTHGYPQTPRGMSFPSTHTAVAVAVAVAVWAIVGTAQRVVLVVLAALVALNRVYIGAHWPIDVVGGAALGLTAACVVLVVTDRVQATRADAARPGR